MIKLLDNEKKEIADDLKYIYKRIPLIPEKIMDKVKHSGERCKQEGRKALVIKQ